MTNAFANAIAGCFWAMIVVFALLCLLIVVAR